MKSIKKFYRENKQLILLTVIILFTIFFVFSGIAIIISKRSGTKDNSEQKEQNTEVTSDSYRIQVNRAANCITVYSRDESGEYTVAVKAITCSTGGAENETPIGEFRTGDYSEWQQITETSYAQYVYKISDELAFCSTAYTSQNKDALDYGTFNKLGNSVSSGNITMSCADAKWLIDNCPEGTYVAIYDDSENPGELGKPDTITIPSSSEFKNWDPTDPDEDNPWNSCTPKITVSSSSVQVKNGIATDALLTALGAKAVDTCGNDITSKIEVSGVKLNTNGKYDSVTLNVTDAIGKSADKVVVQVQVGTTEQINSATEASTTNNTDKDTTKDTSGTDDQIEDEDASSDSPYDSDDSGNEENTTSSDEAGNEENTTSSDETGNEEDISSDNTSGTDTNEEDTAASDESGDNSEGSTEDTNSNEEQATAASDDTDTDGDEPVID